MLQGPKLIDWLQVKWTKGKRGPFRTLTAHVNVGGYESMEAVGVDPGRNFGICYIKDNNVYILYGNLHGDRDWSYGEDALAAYKIMTDFLHGYVVELGQSVSVEDAAFSRVQGQANLGLIRAGFFLAAAHVGHYPQIVNIQTARKAATGNGRVSMSDIMPTIDANASDALGLSLHALGYQAPIRDA